MVPFFKTILAALLTGAALAPSTGIAQSLDVPVMERASDDLDTCTLGEVAGLNPKGDGFLAVRSGPKSSFRKIDEIHNGDQVWLFDRRGKWIGIVYDVQSLSCSPINTDRAVPYRGKKGWVHENWIKEIAG